MAVCYFVIYCLYGITYTNFHFNTVTREEFLYDLLSCDVSKPNLINFKMANVNSILSSSKRNISKTKRDMIKLLSKLI
jgi:hypothetical protein